MTVGEAVDAYRILQKLPPSQLTESLLDNVVDCAQALEEVATSHVDRLEKHRERIVDGEEMTEDEKKKLREKEDDLRQQKADVSTVPPLDPAKASTVGQMRELRNVDALQPLLKSST